MKITKSEEILLDALKQALEWADEYSYVVDRPPIEVKDGYLPGDHIIWNITLRKKVQ